MRGSAQVLFGISCLGLLFWGCGRGTGVRSLPSLPLNTRVIPTEQHYEVTGNSVEEVRLSLRAAAAEALPGRAVGYHRWDVRWTYRYEESPVGCSVSNVTIELSSTITLPEWVPGPAADSSLSAAWDGYVTSIRHHEYCHRVLAYQQANELDREMKRMRSGSCALLTGNVESKGRTIFEKYKKLNEGYDQDSRGSLTWPPRTDGKEPPLCPRVW